MPIDTSAMVDPDRKLLSGLVEIDETSIRHRTGNCAVGRGRSHKGKLMIVGAVEIESRDEKNYPGRIRLSEISDYTAQTLGSFVESAVAYGSVVNTDGLASYAIYSEQITKNRSLETGWPITCFPGFAAFSPTSKRGRSASTMV